MLLPDSILLLSFDMYPVTFAGIQDLVLTEYVYVFCTRVEASQKPTYLYYLYYDDTLLIIGILLVDYPKFPVRFLCILHNRFLQTGLVDSLAFMRLNL